MAKSTARERLAQCVEREGLETVASNIGMSPSGLFYLIDGQRGENITVPIAAAIDAAYGIPMAEWLPWIEAA